MINNDQNPLNTTFSPSPDPISQLPIMPNIQASPSGGVVATLQPGQDSFENKIKVESARKDNFVEQNGPTDFRQEVTTSVELPQAVAVEKNHEEKFNAQALNTNKQQDGPTSVLNYKIGNDLQKKQKTKLFLPILLGGLGLVIVVGLGWFFYEKSVQKKQLATVEPTTQAEVITLDYWGLWEPSQTLTQVLKDFETENPGISVNYVKQNISGYRQRLETAIATGNGPDLFRYHASWRSYLNDSLDTLPATTMTNEQFAQTFYPVATKQLSDTEGNIKGIPLMYDGLALLYNKDLYQQADLEVPKTWAEFKSNARLLTKYGANNYIESAGAAMGLADNVDFATDIVGLLTAQTLLSADEQADVSNPDPQTVADVLTYYTSFYNESGKRTWDETFDNSTSAFARGEVAMILAPSWTIHDVLKINPNLNIGVAAMPQLDVEKPINWATYWAEGVNVNSPRKTAAWKLLKYMSSADVLKQLYQEQIALRDFGEIYSRTDMADLLANNNYIQSYLLNADKAIGLPLNDKTFDEALNDENKKLTSAVINQLTLEANKNVDLTKAATKLIANWQQNFIDYAYMAAPEK